MSNNHSGLFNFSNIKKAEEEVSMRGTTTATNAPYLPAGNPVDTVNHTVIVASPASAAEEIKEEAPKEVKPTTSKKATTK